MIRKHTGPTLIVGSLVFLGLAIFGMVSGSMRIASLSKTVGTVNGYGYTNNTCIVCSTVFHGYPNCNEYPYSGAVQLLFNNCSDTVAVNVCGSTPEKAEKNTEELYKLGTEFDGYAKKCEFHFFGAGANGWGSIIIGLVFFSIFIFLMSLGIYFTRKFTNSYESF